MLQTYTHIERRFIMNEDGGITGIEPVSVREKMVYSDGKLDVPFGYDTRMHTELDVQDMLNEYPSFISRVFNNLVSYFSRKIWRARR
jgi:hypothetical protein